MHVYVIAGLVSKIYWNYIYIQISNVRKCADLCVSLFTKLSLCLFNLLSLCSPGKGGKELNQTPSFFVFRFIAKSLMEMVKF